jgi:hypothetical protein
MDQKLLICIRNDKYQVSLEKRKLYVQLPDPEAEEHHYLRVIDESGEDYLYPKSYFLPVELSEEIRQAVIAAA